MQGRNRDTKQDPLPSSLTSALTLAPLTPSYTRPCPPTAHCQTLEVEVVKRSPRASDPPGSVPPARFAHAGTCVPWGACGKVGGCAYVCLHSARVSALCAWDWGSWLCMGDYITYCAMGFHWKRSLNFDEAVMWPPSPVWASPPYLHSLLPFPFGVAAGTSCVWGGVPFGRPC